MFARSKPVPPAIPTVQKSPTLVALHEKRAEISVRMRKLNVELFDLSSAPDDGIPPSPIAERAAKMLGRDAPATPPGRTERLAALRQEIADCAAALDVLDKDIIDERRRASREICASVAPEYRARLSTFCRAVIEAHKANAALAAFADALENADVSMTSIRVDLPEFFGHPRDRNARPRVFLSEAAKAGLIAATEIPAEFQ